MMFDEWCRWMDKRRATPPPTIRDLSLPWVCRNFGHNPRTDEPICRDCGTDANEVAR